MKKIFLFCTLAVMMCMVSCKGKNEPVDVNAKSLAKHWVGDATEVNFYIENESGKTVMTPDEFATYLDEHKTLALMLGERYLPYIKQMSTLEITDITLKPDFTYSMTAKSGKSTKTAEGTWVELNDVLTIHVSLKDILGIEREGDMDMTVDKLTKTEIELSGIVPVLDADITGIAAGGTFLFKGHAAE